MDIWGTDEGVIAWLQAVMNVMLTDDHLAAILYVELYALS